MNIITDEDLHEIIISALQCSVDNYYESSKEIITDIKYQIIRNLFYELEKKDQENLISILMSHKK